MATPRAALLVGPPTGDSHHRVGHSSSNALAGQRQHSEQQHDDGKDSCMSEHSLQSKSPHRSRPSEHTSLMCACADASDRESQTRRRKHSEDDRRRLIRRAGSTRSGLGSSKHAITELYEPEAAPKHHLNFKQVSSYTYVCTHIYAYINTSISAMVSSERDLCTYICAYQPVCS